MTQHSYEIALALGVLSPLISFWILVFIGPKLGKPAAGWFGVVAGMGVPLALATYVLAGWWGLDPHAREQLTANAFRYHWGNLGSIPLTIGVKLDSLTVAMFFMVTFIAFGSSSSASATWPGIATRSIIKASTTASSRTFRCLVFRC